MRMGVSVVSIAEDLRAEGGHFFLTEHRDQVVSVITQRLAPARVLAP